MSDPRRPRRHPYDTGSPDSAGYLLQADWTPFGKEDSLPWANLRLGLASHAAGDPKRGADTFAQQCAVCHSAEQGRNRLGPSLFAIVDRKAGSVAAYAYSAAMRQSDFSWSPDKIDAYIADPQQVVSGDKMATTASPTRRTAPTSSPT